MIYEKWEIYVNCKKMKLKNAVIYTSVSRAKETQNCLYEYSFYLSEKKSCFWRNHTDKRDHVVMGKNKQVRIIIFFEESAYR